MKLSPRRFGLMWTAAVMLALAEPTHGVITLSGNFDTGSLDESGSSINGNFITLAGRDNFYPGDWKWLYFSAAGVGGAQPTFTIDDDFSSGSSRLANHEMVYSYDQQDWRFFDNNIWQSGSGTYSFWNDEAFDESTVYVAYGLPYEVGRVEAHTASLMGSPWVSPTLSGDANFVLGQSPGGIDDIGRQISPSDLYGYKITDGGVAGVKEKVVLASGVHPNEGPAGHVLEGIVNFLVSDDPRATALREAAEFYVYPLVNPDGRYAGLNRSGVEHPDRDMNRFWNEFLYDDMTDLKIVGEAMKADTGADVDYFVDFHSWTDTEEHFGFVDIDAGLHLDPFWQDITAREPIIATYDASVTNWTGMRFGRDRLNAEFYSTFETQFIPGWDIERFHTFGMNVGLAFAAALAPILDERFEFDDSNGTMLTGASNSLGSTLFSSDVTGVTVEDGVLRVRKPGDNFASSYLDIPNQSEGTLYLSLVIEGWNLTDYDASEHEEVRLGFLDSDGGTGSTITAQAQLERVASGQFVLSGQALGSGTLLDGQRSYSAILDGLLMIVIELDLDADLYQVYTRLGAGAFEPLGSVPATIDPSRDANAIRLVINNSFAGLGEFLDIALISLSSDNPTLGIVGDLDRDGHLDAQDLALLEAAIAVGEANLDLTGDDVVDAEDGVFWISDLFGTLRGDVNLDRTVDLIDLSILASSFGTPGVHGEGDLDFSGVVDLIDLSLLASDFGLSAPVPEPTGLVWCVVVLLSGRCRNLGC
ncbi:MAG: M14 family zinc carboxypeptidase [Phycisphaeraceae bacterium]